ncbi:MAG: hypothetical protein COA41_10275, partial [Sphingopyxis sp.]
MAFTAGFQIGGGGNQVASQIGDIDIRNAGTVSADGEGGAAVVVSRILNDDGDVADTLLTNTGTVRASGEDADAIRHGTVIAEGREDDLTSLGTADFTLTSSSIVQGGSATGAAIRLVGGDMNSITNAGYIGADSGIAIIGGSGSETVSNSGTIEGTVSLGSGDDRFILFSGASINAALDGGDDTDMFALDGESGTNAVFNASTTPLTGFEQFEKRGGSSWQLAGTLSDGAMRDGLVTGGILQVTGQYSALDLTVRSGGTVGGNGTVGAVTLAGGTLSPGGAGSIETSTPVTAAPVVSNVSAPSSAITAIATPPQPAAVDPLPLPPQLTGKALARAEGAGDMIAGGENAPHRTMIAGGENAPHGQMIAGGENIPYLEMIPGGENEPHAVMITGGENIAFADGTLIPGGENVPYSQLIHGGENIPFASGQNIGTLTINGDLTLDASSFFEVEVDDQGNGDRVVVLGSVTLGNATLRVLEMLGGGFAGQDPFNYLIIDNDAMDAVNGVFGSIT